MNINSVNMNTNFGAKKVPLCQIKVVGEGDGYLDEMLKRSKDLIYGYADVHKAPNITLFRKNDELRINSGMITSVLDLSKMEKGKDFEDAIIENIIANSVARTKTLSDGLNLYA